MYLCNFLIHEVIKTPEGARAALGLAGTVLGYYPVSVLPSKTAIAPVNPTFLPQVRKSLWNKSFCDYHIIFHWKLIHVIF